ncbi:MAG: ABC transporter permease [Acidimicrobiales bacterium]|nr:ABC transporter permease [Acidimicrobiales bacterium]
MAVVEGDATTAARVGLVASAPATRGRRQGKLLRIGGDLDLPWRVGLSALGVGAVLLAWLLLAAQAGGSGAVVPSPLATMAALGELWADGVLRGDLWQSTQRIFVGYSVSVLLGVVVGVAIGTFASFESFFEAPIGFLRYIPATALTPVFLLLLGIGESPKIWLVVVGTMFFNILMIADVARSVPREFVNAAYTLGAGRAAVLRRVVLRFSLPGIIDAARVNLAAAWLMLVVAELLAAEKGLAFQIVRAQRFRAVDKMFALLVVFGVIGLVSDLALRWLRNRAAPWARP